MENNDNSLEAIHARLTTIGTIARRVDLSIWLMVCAFAGLAMGWLL